jgi:hypothetical protein
MQMIWDIRKEILMSQNNKKTKQKRRIKKSKNLSHHEELEKIIKEKSALEVYENEEASLQDKTYSFDSDNTGDEDIHVVADFKTEPNFD